MLSFAPPTPRRFGILAALLLAGTLGCRGVDPAPPRPDQLGGFGVGHQTFTVVDPARGDRTLLVDVWYPVDAADWSDTPVTTYPLSGFIGLESAVAVDGLPVSDRPGQSLIVFSHGYQGVNTQSTPLMETLASHGFIVAAPEHTGNAQASPTDDFDTAAANRVPDVSLVIDRMLARARDPADPFYGRIDETRIGVVGHSFGGMTSVGMAAGWAGAAADPRVAAIAPISAVIDGDLQSTPRSSPYAGFSATQLAPVSVPVLLVGGTEDLLVPIANNQLAYDWLTRAPWVGKVDVIGATHTHFANICAIGELLIELGITIDTWPAIGAGDLVDPYNRTCLPGAFPIAEAIRLQNLYVIAFFRRHLRGESDYDRYLTVSYAQGEPDATFTARELTR